MSGRAYTVDSGSMMAGAAATKSMGSVFSGLSSAVAGINVPPGVEAAPQAKLGVVSRRLRQVGHAVRSQGPYLANAARWAAIFESPSGGAHLGSYSGFPGAAPGLVSPFANVDATDHPGPDFLSGVVSVVPELVDSLPGLAHLAASPVTWAIKNERTLRFGVANTGKITREAWRGAYASDAGDAGDRDYAAGKRTTTVLTLPVLWGRAAHTLSTIPKATAKIDAARRKEGDRQTAYDAALRQRVPLRGDMTRDERKARDKRESDLRAARRKLAWATLMRQKAVADKYTGPYRAYHQIGMASGATVGVVAAPIAVNNLENAEEREREGK